jgi:hypothetical protein
MRIKAIESRVKRVEERTQVFKPDPVENQERELSSRALGLIERLITERRLTEVEARAFLSERAPTLATYLPEPEDDSK